MGGKSQDHLVELLRACFVLAKRLERVCKDWQERGVYTSSPAARDLLSLWLAASRALSVKANTEYVSALKGRKLDADTVRGFHDQVRTLSDIGSLLDNSTQRSLHPVLSPTVQFELEALEVKGRVLVSGTPEMSYELMTMSRDTFAGLVEASILEKMEWPIHVILVPHAPLDSALNHVLVFHEVGHAIFKDKRPVGGVAIPSGLHKRWSRSPRKALYPWKFTEIAEEWQEELFSDVFGLLLVGPSFLSAFCRVLGGFYPLDTASKGHPPTGLRMRLLIEVATRRGFLDDHLPAPISHAVKDWLRSVKALQDGYQTVNEEELPAELIADLVTFAVGSHKDLVKAAEELLGKRVFSQIHQQADVERGNLLYEYQIPPIEDTPATLTKPGTPLSPARVFASCWAAYHLAVEASGNDLDKLQASHYDDALLEALDASQALRAWLTA